MEFYREEAEVPDPHMFRTVLGMFEGHPHMQRIIRCGLLGIDYEDELDVPCDDDDYDNWSHNFHGYSPNRLRSSSTVYQPVYSSARNSSCPSSLRFQTKDAERKARLLEESKKSKEKAEKKRLKKQKQKERKRLEKQEKEKLNPEENEEGKDDSEQSKAEGSKPVNDQHNANNNSSVKLQASAKDTDTSDSSDDESSDEDGNTKNDSGDSEELDMTSTFVRKAALIAKHKLEQKPRPEKKEKKKISDKEEYKTVPEKSNEEKVVTKKSTQNAAASSIPTFEDNVKISTDFAVMGNKYASDGNFNKAVKYFTDAIKHNPKEFKLFGNRSFCFEKLQEYEKALMDAELSLGICPGWVKGLYRKGRALAGLKRYEEAALAFMEVLKLDSSCAEAAQELMRVQITQLMECGFTREQSSNALIIHGTVEKALEVLSKLNNQPGALQNGALPPVQVANVTGVSPILSANTNPAPAAAVRPPAQFKDALKTPLMNKPLGPVQNTSAAQNQSKPILTQPVKASNGVNRPLELFPVWVGNLNFPVTESMIANLFNKVGVVYSVKVLTAKRCAFVNFTKQEHCDEAIQRFHGFELNHNKLAVRYPDRIPPGMGISKSALRADDLQDENLRYNENSQRPVRPYKPVPNHRGEY
ncbi:tetratricopeptide repeat protein 31-like isoform X1 [Archocentrus centrarchus]|uniref:tetratricopeptide repeat protein 31-like isoform X1 n=1 Tax=Archocentrus centrarchus TaxID=63155 RepID=UPI0011EA1262|nr:tetratricopeptide repeat protein 31-like isoform X1 [Archocentrus centrarchus]